MQPQKQPQSPRAHSHRQSRKCRSPGASVCAGFYTGLISPSYGDFSAPAPGPPGEAGALRPGRPGSSRTCPWPCCSGGAQHRATGRPGTKRPSLPGCSLPAAPRPGDGGAHSPCLWARGYPLGMAGLWDRAGGFRNQELVSPLPHPPGRAEARPSLWSGCAPLLCPGRGPGGSFPPVTPGPGS